MTPELVVKLGGSHAESPLLRPWLRALAEGHGRIVVVPGGGPFADAVRQAQPVMGFDDQAAHDMALLAMAQYGRALAMLEPRLVLADSWAALRSAFESRRVPVWSPWPMLRDAPGIPASWDITSDTLALWLAAELRAPRLLLIKHRACPAASSCRLLVEQGLVDAGFLRFLPGFGGQVLVAGPDDLPAAGIDPAAPPGQLIAS